MPIGYATRVASFSAAHRLQAPSLTNEENAALYGMCNRVNGHGHNYKVEITMRGEIDPITGMVINLKDLKRFIDVCVMDQLDHRNLDLDVDFFLKNPSTSENLAFYIWKELNNMILKEESKAKLHEVKLWETDKNCFSYKGE